jgi:putative ABC transport system permease protein
MIFSISWRNIWRSKTRSLVIISAISLGIFAGVFTVAFMHGWVNQRIDAVISTEISHIQIHHPSYLQSNETADFMEDADSIQASLVDVDEVKASSIRVLVNCMIASAEAGTGIQLTGINPEKEKQVTNLHEKIIEGEYFEGTSDRQIVISQKLAEKLKVSIRSRVVVTLAGLDGTITGGSFRVAGIYRTSNTVFDETRAFVNDDKLRELLQLAPSTGHQVAILLHENQQEEMVARELSSIWPNMEILTWTKLMPDMQMINEYMSLMMYIVVGIILLALGFGIVNTMLMVILERVKELGMLMAVGMNRRRIFMMIVLESVFLSLTGGVIGITLALILTAITGHTGINLGLWADGLNSMGYDSMVYPWIGIDSVLGVTGLVIVTGIISALYPAQKAIKLNPAEAVRIDM